VLTPLGRSEARWLDPVGFSFVFARRGRLLILRFKLVLLWRAQVRSQESGGPPFFEPSLKVEGDTAHSQNSAFAPGLKSLNAPSA
jgi:hypothetical protein